jgi:hypothetical protein
MHLIMAIKAMVVDFMTHKKIRMKAQIGKLCDKATITSSQDIDRPL